MLWAYPRDTGWDLPVELSRVATPLEECVVVSPGEVNVRILALLERKGFDQAPVGRHSSVNGIVETSHLRQLLAQGRPLQLGDSAITLPTLEVVSPLRDVLHVLAEHRAAIVVF